MGFTIYFEWRKILVNLRRTTEILLRVHLKKLCRSNFQRGRWEMGIYHIQSARLVWRQGHLNSYDSDATESTIIIIASVNILWLTIRSAAANRNLKVPQNWWFIILSAKLKHTHIFVWYQERNLSSFLSQQFLYGNSRSWNKPPVEGLMFSWLYIYYYRLYFVRLQDSVSWIFFPNYKIRNFYKMYFWQK